jgi:hypothetical protein
MVQVVMTGLTVKDMQVEWWVALASPEPRFKTRCWAVELRFAVAGGVGQDRGSCLSVCCT